MGRFGWQEQSERLALTHVPMGIAAMTLAKRAREQAFSKANALCSSSEGEPSNSNARARELAAANSEDFRAQLTRQRLAASEMRKRIDVLFTRAADAEGRYADLEDELNVARREILLQQDDKHLLQTSLDLLISENELLTRRLAESDSQVEKTRHQIEHGEAALKAAELARGRLSAAVDETNRKQQVADDRLDAVKLECEKLTAALDRMDQRHQADNQKLKALRAERSALTAALNETDEKRHAEVDRLKASLEATTARAAVAENLVARVREILLEKFTLLQSSVTAKNGAILDLERSHIKLIDGTKMLLEIFAMRDTALARADARIAFLTERIAELEADLHRSSIWHSLETLDDSARSGFLGRAQPEIAAGHTDPNPDEELAADGKHLERPRQYVAEAMLAATITL
jgi:crescentin